MPDTYCIESNCYAFSGRSSSEPGRVRAYFKLTEGEATTAILGLLEQGIPIEPILKAIAAREGAQMAERVEALLKQENW